MVLNFAPLIDHKDNKEIKSVLLFSQYYQEYYKENFRDLSFIILDDKRVLGYVLCAALNGQLTLPEGGIKVSLFTELLPNEKKKIYQVILDKLCTLAQENHCQKIVFKDSLYMDKLSPVGELLFNNRFQSLLTFDMQIDYANFDVNSYYASLRKSYKSLVNWGRKELKVSYLNQDNPDLNMLKKFQEFHQKISGRKTRSDESWLLQYQMIQEGMAELILAEYNDTLVAGSLYADYGDTSVYFTGVYERDLFEYGISHFLLYEGICRSYERGNTTGFSLGHFDTDIQDSKWYNIQFFKKGFCGKFEPTILWSRDLMNSNCIKESA